MTDQRSGCPELCDLANWAVIAEGFVTGQSSDAEVLDAYNAKYDWDYTIDAYGPFTTVGPAKVMAWRSAGWAGREGFQQTGRWRFEAPGG